MQRINIHYMVCPGMGKAAWGGIILIRVRLTVLHSSTTLSTGFINISNYDTKSQYCVMGDAYTKSRFIFKGLLHKTHHN